MATPLISFSGLASGIDSASLIQALLDRERAARVTPLQTKIDEFTETNDAFGELKDLLTALQTAASKFRLVNGGGISKQANSTDETVFSASVSNSALNGNYGITVNALAKNGTYSFASSATAYGSSDAVINSNISGGDTDVVIEVGAGSELETVTITLDNTTTLSEFVSEFNNQSTKATASVINVGTSSSPDYRVAIVTNNTGLEKGQVSVTVGSGITDPDGNPLTTDGAWDNNSISQATNADISIAGIGSNIIRSTNSISDILAGVTLELKSTGSASLTVGDDASATTQSMQDFVDAYNEVITYINENDIITQEDEGTEVTNVFGSLARSSLDDNIISALRSALSSVSLSGSTVNTMADLGVTTERDGTLKFDSTVFQSALSEDPSRVETLTQSLGETLASTTGTIAQYTQFNGLIDVATRANQNQIDDYNDRIANIEKQLSAQEDMLTQRFGRLEALIGQLTSQQNALASILPK